MKLKSKIKFKSLINKKQIIKEINKYITLLY